MPVVSEIEAVPSSAVTLEPVPPTSSSLTPATAPLTSETWALTMTLAPGAGGSETTMVLVSLEMPPLPSETVNLTA